MTEIINIDQSIDMSNQVTEVRNEWIMHVHKNNLNQTIFHYVFSDNNSIIVSETYIEIRSLQKNENLTGNEIIKILMTKIVELCATYKINKVFLQNYSVIYGTNISLKHLQFLTRDNDFYSKFGFRPIHLAIKSIDDFHHCMNHIQSLSLNTVISEMRAVRDNLAKYYLTHILYIHHCYYHAIMLGKRVDKSLYLASIATGVLPYDCIISTDEFLNELTKTFDNIIDYLRNENFTTLGDVFRYLASSDIDKFNEMILQTDGLSASSQMPKFYSSWMHLSNCYDIDDNKSMNYFSWSWYVSIGCITNYRLIIQ